MAERLELIKTVDKIHLVSSGYTITYDEATAE